MQTVQPQKTLVEQTYDILVDAICEGRLAPGERLTQDAIAARLNVSRQPVHAALGLLRTNHLVEDAGRRGVVVSRIDPEFLQSLYEFRRVVEPLAVELACRTPLTEEIRAEGAAIIAAGWAAQAGGELLDLVRADVAFHSFIYRLSGNLVIMDTMRTNWHHIRRAMSVILRGEGHSARVWREHEQIFAAMVAGDAERAATAMRDHIRFGTATLGADAGSAAAR